MKRFFDGRRRFATVLVILGVVVMAGLGVWQLRRLDERRAINAAVQAKLDLPPLELSAAEINPAELSGLAYRHVRIQGEYDPAQEIILRNQEYNNIPGVHLVTPVRLEGTDQVIFVDRGWIPYNRDPKEFAVSGKTIVEGIVEPTQAWPGGISPVDPTRTPDQSRLEKWYRVDIARIQEQVQYPLAPVFVIKTSDFQDGALPIKDVDIDLSEGSHVSYAIQWFSFATILAVGYVVLVLRSR